MMDIKILGAIERLATLNEEELAILAPALVRRYPNLAELVAFNIATELQDKQLREYDIIHRGTVNEYI